MKFGDNKMNKYNFLIIHKFINMLNMLNCGKDIYRGKGHR